MEETKKKSLMDRFLNTVEVAGNKLPDPATLFILLACIVLVLSAVFASIMGSVTGHYVGFVTPNLADFFHSIELVTMVVVGGMASVYGSLVGAVLLTALPQALTAFEGWETVAFGAILMACMIFMPKGLVPTLAAKFARGK